MFVPFCNKDYRNNWNWDVKEAVENVGAKEGRPHGGLKDYYKVGMDRYYGGV